MTKTELLEYLLNNIECFHDVSIEDFNLLASLETDELGLVNEKVSKITPLLKQICEYSIIKDIINNEDLSEMEAYIDEDDDMLDDIIDIVEICSQYVEELIKGDCHHPSVLLITDQINGMKSYSQFNDILNEFIELTEDNILEEDLLDLSIETIDRHLDILVNSFHELIIKLKNNKITNKQELLFSMNNYCQNFINIMMLVSKNNNNCESSITYFDNNYVIVTNNDFIHPNLTILDILDNQSEIISMVEEYQEEYSYDIDSEIDNIITNIMDRYTVYKSYKYRYLKNSYKEQKLLQKCKKM